jgi:UDP-glucose 4-epimerase
MKNVDMTVLLTGGTGFIGSHTAVALLQAGERVVLLDNLINSSAEIVSRVEVITGQPIVFVQVDVRDTTAVKQALVQYGCEAVIHFAGLKAVGESVAQPFRYFDNNVVGTLSLLRAMDEAGVRRLVFSSSATVYGDPLRLPLDEQHPTSALNPYGRTKLRVEEILADVCRADPSWQVMCLRYFNPAGAHSSGLIGEDPFGTPNNLVPYLARVAHGDLPFLQVFGDDYPTSDGTGVRDYIHVEDVAVGHVQALRHLNRTRAWQVLNLGTGSGYSVLEMLRLFERTRGCSIPYRIAPRRPGDTSACYADPTRAEQVLNWRATRTIDDICASAWRWLCNSRTSIKI